MRRMLCSSLVCPSLLAALSFFSPSPCMAAASLLFKSGFEDGVATTQSPKPEYPDHYLKGADTTVVGTSNNDWDELDDYDYLPWAQKFYGKTNSPLHDEGQLYILPSASTPPPAPVGSPTDNRVMGLFTYGTPGEDAPRASLTIAQATDLDDFTTLHPWHGIPQKDRFNKIYTSYDMYIPSDLRDAWAGYDKATHDIAQGQYKWYMIWESHANLDNDFYTDYRHQIGISKKKDSDDWFFKITQEEHYNAREGDIIWENATSWVTTENGEGTMIGEDEWIMTDGGDNPSHWQDVSVPFDQWFKLEVFFEHSLTDGRLYVAITPEQGDRKVVADYRGPTEYDMSIGNTNEKRGLFNLELFKMYHHSEHFTKLGALSRPLIFQQYYDNFEIWSDSPYTLPSPGLAPVPEPASALLIVSLIAGLGACRPVRRRMA